MLAVTAKLCCCDMANVHNMQDPRSFGREAATLNQLLHMADNEPDTSNPHLALLQSLQSQLPSRVVSGAPHTSFYEASFIEHLVFFNAYQSIFSTMMHGHAHVLQLPNFVGRACWAVTLSSSGACCL